jgi:amidase
MLDWTGWPQEGEPFAAPAKERPYTEEVAESPGALRIAWSGQAPSGIELGADVAQVLLETVDLVHGLGHETIERPLEMDWRAFYRAINTAGAGDFAKGVAREIALVGREPAERDFEPITRALWEGSKRVSAEQAYEAASTAKELCWRLVEQWADFDVFLSPVMITPPPKLGFLDPKTLDPKEHNKRQRETFGFTPPANFTGQPSISLPLGMSGDGLPIGMMFTGRYADEATLFRLAAQIEAAQPWAQRRAPIRDQD